MVGSYPTRFSFKVGGTLRVAILFVIGISSLIPHSGFLIRHCFINPRLGATFLYSREVFLYQ
jgi:hypothetical protein